jgi:hypothetical protein
MLDIDPYLPALRDAPRNYLNCGNQQFDGFQGISKGWGDTYVWKLGGQYFVLDGGDGQPVVPAGNYYIEVEVNPAYAPDKKGSCPRVKDPLTGLCHQFAEGNYANNTTRVLVDRGVRTVGSGEELKRPNRRGRHRVLRGINPVKRRPSSSLVGQCMIAVLAIALPLTLQAQASRHQPAVFSRSAPIIERGGLRFKDLNRNGVLDPYEDWRLSASARAHDLVRRMTLEEKAGMMMHGTTRSGGPQGVAGIGASYDTAATGSLIPRRWGQQLITRLNADPARPRRAEKRGRWRSGRGSAFPSPSAPSAKSFQYRRRQRNPADSRSGQRQRLRRARDASLVRHFADIARQEYRAVGIEETLSPQADLATGRAGAASPDLRRDPERAR